MRKLLTLIVVTFTLTAFSQKNGDFAKPLAEDLCTSAAYLCVGPPALSTPTIDSTGGGAVTAGDPTITCTGAPGRTVWYRFDSYSQATGGNQVDIVIDVTTAGATLNAAVYELTGANCSSAGDLTEMACGTGTDAGGANEIILSFNPAATGRTYFVMIDGGAATNVDYLIEMNENTPGTVTGIPLPTLTTDAPSIAFTKKQCLTDDDLVLTNSTLVNGTGMRYNLIFSNAGGNLAGSPISFSGGADTTISLSSIGASTGFHDFEIRVSNQCQNNRNFGETVEFLEMQAAATPTPMPICLNTPVTFNTEVNLVGDPAGSGTNPITDGTLTYSWNFGDPNSGADNTFASSDPLDSAIHTFVGGVAPQPDGSEMFSVELIVNSNDQNNCPADTATVSVTINAPLDIAIADTVQACQGVDPQLTATPNNGVAPHTYAWNILTPCVGCTVNDPDADPTTPDITLQSVPAGQYQVALQTVDSQGCLDNDTVLVLVGSPDVDIRITGPNPPGFNSRFVGDTICPFSQVDFDTTHISGFGPFSFNWGGIGLDTTQASGSDASFATTTQVTLFVRDTAGCVSDTDTVAINVYPPATMTPNPMPICANDAPLTATLTIDPPLVLPVNWSDTDPVLLARLLGGANGNIDSLVIQAADTAGPLSFTAIGVNSVTGCIDTVMGSITVQPPVTVTLGAVPDTICLGDSTTITATSNGQSFAWREIGVGAIAGTSNTLRYSSATSGNKRIEVTAGDTTTLCFQRDTITIVINDVPQPQITTTGNICTNTDIILRGLDTNIPPVHPDSIETHAWTALNGTDISLLSTTNAVSTTFNTATPDTFTYVYTATDGNCSTSDTIGFRIHPRPNIEIIGNYYREPFCDMEEFAYVVIDTNILSRPIPIASETFTTPGIAPRPAFIPPFLQGLISNDQDPNAPQVLLGDVLDSVNTSATYPWVVTDVNGCDTTATFTVTPFSPPSANGGTVCIREDSASTEWTIDIDVTLSTERSDSVNTNISTGERGTGNPLMSINRQVRWLSLDPPAGGDNTLSDANPCFNITTDADGLGILAPPSDTNTVVPTETFVFDSLAFASTPVTCPLGTWTFNIEVYDGATGCTDTITSAIEFGDTAAITFAVDTMTICEGQNAVLTAAYSNATEANLTWERTVNPGTARTNIISGQDTIANLDTLGVGFYTYYLTGTPDIPGGTNACVRTDSIVVRVLSALSVAIDPIVPAALVNDTARLCAVDSFMVGVNTPITSEETVRWFYNDTANFLAQSATLFTDTFTVNASVIMKYGNAAGCEILDTIPFAIVPLPDTTSTVAVTSANALLPNTVCSSDTVTFTATMNTAPPATNRFFLVDSATSNAISDTVAANGSTVTLQAVLTDTTTITIVSFDTQTGCEIAFNDTITINVLPPPVAVVQADQQICAGVQFTIDGSGSTPQPGLSYAFFSTDTSNNVTVANTADSLVVTVSTDSTFMLQVTEIATGCISELDSINFTTITATTANASRDTFICAGSDYVIPATGTGSVINWTTSAANQNQFSRLDTLNPTYTPDAGATRQDTLVLTVTSPACPVVMDTILIDVINGAVATITSATPNPICTGDTVFLAGSVFNADSSWSSSFGGSFQNDSVAFSNFYIVDTALNQGNVTLSLIANNNQPQCNVDTATTTITLRDGPIAVYGNDTAICQGTALNLASARVVGETRSWSALNHHDSTFSSTTAANPVFTPLGTYNGLDTLVVTATNAQCPEAKTDTIIVNISPAAFAQIDRVATPNQICSGDTLPVVGTILNADSLWSTNNAVGTFTDTSNTTSSFVADTAQGQNSMMLYLIAKDGPDGCATDTDSVAITIINGPIAVATTSLNGLDTICQGTSLNLSENNKARVLGTAINWTSSTIAGGAFNDSTIAQPTFTPLATFNGLDTLVVTATNGNCPANDRDSLFLTVQTAPVAEITATRDTSCQTFGYQLSSTAENGTIRWTGGFGTFNDTTISNPVYTVSAADAPLVQLNLLVTGTIAGGGITCSNARDSIVLQVNQIPTATIDRANLDIVNNVFNACNGVSSSISATVSLPNDSIKWVAIPANSMVIDQTDTKNITIVPNTNFSGMAELVLFANNAPCLTVSDTLKIEVLDRPDYTLSGSSPFGFNYANDTACAKEQVTVSIITNYASNSYSYFLIDSAKNDTVVSYPNLPVTNGFSVNFLHAPVITTDYIVSVAGANCNVDTSLRVNVHTIPTAVLATNNDTVCLINGVYPPQATVNNGTEGGFWSHTGNGSWLGTDSVTPPVNYVLAGADTNQSLQLTFTPIDTARCGANAFTRPATMNLTVLPNARFGEVNPISAFLSSSAGQVRYNNDTLYVQQGMQSIIVEVPTFNTAGVNWAQSANGKGSIAAIDKNGNNERMEYTFSKTDGAFETFFITATPTSNCNPLGPDTIVVAFNELKTVNVITPNGDGKNDYLRFTGYAEGGQLHIFNRWGLKVYESNNYRNNWNGELVEDDTYFYIFVFNGVKYTGYVRILSEK